MKQQETDSRGELLTSLREFFEGYELPRQPIRLDACTIIEGPALFVESHLAMAANLRPQYAQPYLDRLLRFRDLILEVHGTT